MPAGEAGPPRIGAVRTRITDCTDLDTLDRWFDRAITATDAAELFADE